MLCQLNNRGLDVEFAHVLLSLFVFFVQLIFSLKIMEEEKEVVRTLRQCDFKAENQQSKYLKIITNGKILKVNLKSNFKCSLQNSLANDTQLCSKWLELEGNMWSCSLILQVRIVLRIVLKIVLCGGRHQSQLIHRSQSRGIRPVGVYWLVSLAVMLRVMRLK